MQITENQHWTGSKGMLWSPAVEHWPTAPGKALKLTFLFQAIFQCYEVFIEYKINLRIIAVKKLLQVTSIHNIWKEEQSNYTRAERQDFQAFCKFSIKEWKKGNTKLFQWLQGVFCTFSGSILTSKQEFHWIYESLWWGFGSLAFH